MKELERIIAYMNMRMQSVFNMMDAEVLGKINEIRVRKGGYLVLVIRSGSYFVDDNGDLYDKPSPHCLVTGEREFEELILSLCDYSLYNHTETMKKGYITLPYGARVGLAGRGHYDASGAFTVNDISAASIRIPREVLHCGDGILKQLYSNALPSVLVAGMPGCGKTTLLRDLARGLSDGETGPCRKVCVVDERNEIGGCGTLYLGVNTDVLCGYRKAQGTEIAVRTLSPQVIVCDEIDTKEELESVLYGFVTGVSFLLSTHLKDREDLYRKEIVVRLLETGVFDYVVLLKELTYQAEMIPAREVLYEIHRRAVDSAFYHGGRDYGGGKSERKSGYLSGTQDGF